MQLFQSWKESARLFGPESGKQFALVTLKTIISTYTTVLAYCWLPFVLYLFGDMIQLGIVPPSVADVIGFHGVVTASNLLWGSGILFLVIFLAARPSVLPKTYTYFISYWYYALYIALFLLMSELIKMGIVRISIGGLYAVYLFFVMIWSAFFILFLLDTDGSPRAAAYSLYASAKMVVLNAPGVIIAWAAAFLASFVVLAPLTTIELLINSSRESVEQFFDDAGFLLVVPLYASVLSNVYIKRLHDQFGRYFTVKEQAE